jgi:hypothetical protein
VRGWGCWGRGYWGDGNSLLLDACYCLWLECASSNTVGAGPGFRKHGPMQFCVLCGTVLQAW